MRIFIPTVAIANPWVAQTCRCLACLRLAVSQTSQNGVATRGGRLLPYERLAARKLLTVTIRFILTAVAAAAVVGAEGCGGGHVAQTEPVVTVQVAPVQEGKIQRIISGEAVLYPVNQSPVVPKISAPVRAFYVERGSVVHAGQLLAVLENRDLVAAVASAKGALEQAEAVYDTATGVTVPEQIQAAQLNLQAARQAMIAQRLVYQSRQKLYKQGALARNLLDQSKVLYVQDLNNYRTAEEHLKNLQAVGRQAQIKAAKAQLADAQGKYLAAKAQLYYSEIRSPINGIVASRPLYPGEMANAGSPLMTIMDTSQVIARVYVSPQQAAWLQKGDAAKISAGGEVPSVDARVAVVSPALDPNSTTVQIWVQAANPHDRLKPGETVNVSMVAQTLPHALVIPASAVLTASGGTESVMVAGADGRAHQMTIKTGIREGDLVQVLSGLRAGERVVSEGAYGLPNGTKIKF